MEWKECVPKEKQREREKPVGFMLDKDEGNVGGWILQWMGWLAMCHTSGWLILPPKTEVDKEQEFTGEVKCCGLNAE